MSRSLRTEEKKVFDRINELIKGYQSASQWPETLLLVGSGAVRMVARNPPDDSSWHVVNKALNACFGAQHPVTPGNENFVLANLVFKMRALHCQPTGSALFMKQRAAVANEYKTIINSLASELLAAETAQAIELRKSFAAFVEPELVGTTVGAVTTNWDTLLDRYFASRFPVMHLHGSVQDPSHLLLPSEIVLELYRANPLVLKQRHKQILEHLEHAKKIIIYGLSLDPLDAELNTILGDSLLASRSVGKPKTDVLVIDSKPQRVVDRLRYFDHAVPVRTQIV